MTRIVLSAATILAAFSLQAQNVTIPDANFKAYLVGNSAINTNGDNEIQVSEAQAFTGSIDCSNLSVTSLVGIEAFTAATDLSCMNNQITSLDVSANTALTAIRLRNNQLTSLDVSANTALQILSCEDNLITSLDLSNNSAFVSLRAHNNRLTSVNLANGNNTNIGTLNIYGNPDLACIQVDDSTYSVTNWPNGDIIAEDAFLYDTTVVFSENCANIVAVNQSLSDNPQISVYPNPTKNNINFSAPAHAQITNITGQILIQQQNTNSLDLSDLPAGVYFLTLQNQNGRTLQVNKILKE